MARRRSVSPWAGSILSGLLFVVAFEPINWWWCGWLVLAPIWIALRTSEAVRQSPMSHGYVIGLIYIFGCFWWVGAVTLTGLGIMLGGLSLYQAVWVLFAVRLLRLPPDARPFSPLGLVVRAGLAAIFWLTLEWLRSFVLNGFNWNELGVSQVPSLHLRQLAALGGVPLLTAAVAAVGILLGEAILQGAHRRWRPMATAASFAGLIIVAGWSYGAWRLHAQAGQTPRGSISYAAIQPDIDEIPYDKAKPAEITRLEIAALTVEQNLSAQAVAARPDLLVWPEAITVQPLTHESVIGQVVDHLHGIYRGDILLGAEDYQGGKLYNTAYLVGPDGSRQGYRKVYLVLLGEYLPMTDIFPWLRQWWGRGTSVTAGTVPGHLLLSRDGLSVAPLMCFEDTQPQVAWNAAARRPDFFATLVNAGWFTGPMTSWCLNQHLENARLRCVEHDRPMIRCADTGITCQIDEDGRVVARLPANTPTGGILYHRLFLHPWEPTLYDRWGDWFGWTSHLVTLGVCVGYLLSRKGLVPSKIFGAK